MPVNFPRGGGPGRVEAVPAELLRPRPCPHLSSMPVIFPRGGGPGCVEAVPAGLLRPRPGGATGDVPALQGLPVQE